MKIQSFKNINGRCRKKASFIEQVAHFEWSRSFDDEYDVGVPLELVVQLRGGQARLAAQLVQARRAAVRARRPRPRTRTRPTRPRRRAVHAYWELEQTIDCTTVVTEQAPG